MNFFRGIMIGVPLGVVLWATLIFGIVAAEGLIREAAAARVLACRS